MPRFVLIALLIGGALAATVAAAAPSHAATYTSPHFTGPKTLPRNFVAARPPAPVTLATDGALPHVFVDQAGTAHIAWSQQGGDQPAVMHYCRLPRGGRACTASQAIGIAQPSLPGNDPSTDDDFAGPVPMAIGNELVTLDARCCNVAPTPGGDTSGTPTYLFTSEDGGSTFTGPTPGAPTGGVVGTIAPSGGATIWGGGDPAVGIVTDNVTGGTFFQGIAAGQFTPQAANLSVENGADAYDGRVSVDGIRPIVAFDDLDGTTFVREWRGSGSVNDAAQWSLTKVDGAHSPRIAGGPRGVVLLTESEPLPSPLAVRRLTDAGTTVGPPRTLTSHNAAFPAVAEDPVSGAIAVSWLDRSARTPAIHVRTSIDGGTTWGPDTIIASLPGADVDELAIAATADGGGFVTFRDAAGGAGTLSGKVQAAQFGPIAATGKAGLGLTPGGSGPTGGDTSAFTSCSDVHMGDIDALATAGCFLRDPKNQASGAAIATGTIRLNGLDIVPDVGAKIFIDPRRHTIETQGDVSVELTGLDDGPIVLWHGELNVTLPAVGASTTLFDFDTSQFAAVLKGFPIDGRIQVKLTHDGVTIPIHLKLPAYMGGVHGDATLVADNATGLHLDSMNIGIDDVNVGALELKNIAIDYQFADDLWDGHGEVLLPGPLSPDLQVRDIAFQHGKFKHAFVDLGLYPGIPVFTDVYLHSIGIGIGLNPTKLEGEIVAGAIPIAPPDDYTVTVTGRVKLQIGDATHPTVFFVGGSGAILGLDLAQASFTYNSDGYTLFHIALDYGEGSRWASFSAKGDVFILHGDFGADLDAHGCLAYVCGGLKAGASKKGIAICDSGENLGADVTFSPFSVDLHPTSCHISDFAIQPPPAAARSLDAGGAAARTFTVAPGQTGVDLRVDGVGGAPDLTVVDPSGHEWAPQALTATDAAVVGGADPTPGATDTVIGLREPTPGTWTVRTAPGSPAIAQLSMAHDAALPQITGRITGNGATRTLHYATGGLDADTTVEFAEQTSEGLRRLGAATGNAGTLTFTPAPGNGGRRAIVAVVMQSGFNRGQPIVARYTAPGIRRPGRVANVSLIHRGTTATVRFGPAAGALRYAVLLTASDGTATQQTIRRGHTATFRGLRAGVKVQALVRGVNVRGAKGPVTKSTRR